MILTNRANLPELIVRAVSNDPYNRGKSDITVTELIGPPQIRSLKRQFGDLLEEDVSERIWTLLGSAVHNIIERAGGADGMEHTLQEQRLYMDVGGLRLSGQYDAYNVRDEHLMDVKVTSVWAVRKGVKVEWMNQLNCLAHLIRANGGNVKRASIIAILRDWKKSDARREADYPQVQVLMIDVPLWSPEDTQDYIERRVALHSQEEVVECTDDERWIRTDYAVMKAGAAKAQRVLSNLDDALLYVNDKGGEMSGLKVVERKSQPTRCIDYCPAAQFCTQWNAENNSKQEHATQEAN